MPRQASQKIKPLRQPSETLSPSISCWCNVAKTAADTAQYLARHNFSRPQPPLPLLRAPAPEKPPLGGSSTTAAQVHQALLLARIRLDADDAESVLQQGSVMFV
eukprot:2962709-Pyramimonas_sp.AAC.1